MKIMLNDFSGHPFQIQLSRQLAKRGHRVLHTYCASFLTPHGAVNDHEKDMGALNIEPIVLETSFDKYGLLSRWNQERRVGRALVNSASRFGPDIIISANTPLGAQGLLLKYSRRRNIPFVFWMQDIYSVGIAEALKRRLSIIGGLIGLGFRYYERHLLTTSTHVVLISGDFLPYLPEVVSRKRATIIENWAPLEELPVLPKSNEWSRKHGLDSSICLLYSGTLGMKHNPTLLLELAKRFHDREDVKIVVISEGSGAEYLAKEKTARGLGNLLIMPFQPFKTMPQVLACADILVAILEKEAGIFAVPSKVLTYLCARRPLLLAVPSDNLAARIVRDHQAGLVVSPDDVPSFIVAAKRLLDDKGLRAMLASNGRYYAERTFDIDGISDRFETILQRALAGQSRSA